MGKKRNDIIGKTFGRLTVLDVPPKRKDNGALLYTCQCSCPAHTIILVRSGNLQSGNTRSCGCIKADILPKVLGCHEGSSIQGITRKQPAKSKNPHKGVSITPSGRYRAQITFKHKVYELGIYEDLAEAIRAREKAEELIFAPFLAKYKHGALEKPSAPQTIPEQPQWWLTSDDASIAESIRQAREGRP